MIYFFVILAKQKIVFVLGMAHMTPFLCKLGPKMAILRDFSKKIFRTSYWITIKVINIKIESPNVFHWKPAKKKKKLKWVWSWGKSWAKIGPML